jgi:hypothetical protein
VWLGLSLVLVVLTTAAVAALPLRRESRALLEVGLVLVAVMLVSPLTEDLYLTLLVIPLFALYTWVREADWRARSTRIVAGATFVLWALLCVSWRRVYTDLWLRSDGSHTVLADVYMVAAAGIWLSLLLAFFVLLLYVLRLSSGQSSFASVRWLIVAAPALGRAWRNDAWTAVAALVPRTATKILSRAASVGARET